MENVEIVHTIHANRVIDEMDREIDRLRQSEYVLLFEKYQQLIHQRRAYMEQLRIYERKGKALAEDGITLEGIEEMLDGLDEEGQE